MLLDQNYVNDLKELDIENKGSGFLSVDQLAWKNELYRLERFRNGGCLLAFIAYVPLTGLVLTHIRTAAIAFLIGFGIAMQFRISGGKIYSNLYEHGKYDYEVRKDKIVRYASSTYLRFDFKEIKRAKKKRYGIVLYKHIDINSYLLNPKHKNLMVIPNKTQAYQQIYDYLVSKGIIKNT